MQKLRIVQFRGTSDKPFHKKLLTFDTPIKGVESNHLKWGIKGYEMDIKNIHSGR